MIPDLRGAVSFLTRVPVSPPKQPVVARWVPWFPVVGALIGLSVGAVYALATSLLPSVAAAGLAVCSGVLLTGGLHEDGLADTADALGAPRSPEKNEATRSPEEHGATRSPEEHGAPRSPEEHGAPGSPEERAGRARAEALRILKDPRLGTFGVLAVVFSVLLRTVAIATMDRWSALAMLVCAHAGARAAAIALFGLYEPASDEGLGASYGRTLSASDVVATVAGGLLLGILAAGLWGAPALLLGLALVWPLGRLAAKRLAGLTGDVLGAAEQTAETAILLLGSAVVANNWTTPAWWS